MPPTEHDADDDEELAGECRTPVAGPDQGEADEPDA